MCRGRKGKPAGAFDASHNHVGAGVGIQLVHDASDSQRERGRNNRSGHNQPAPTLNFPGWRSAPYQASAANGAKEDKGSTCESEDISMTSAPMLPLEALPIGGD